MHVKEMGKQIQGLKNGRADSSTPKPRKAKEPETPEDPEKKRQEATLEELTRINMKIVSIFDQSSLLDRICVGI